MNTPLLTFAATLAGASQLLAQSSSPAAPGLRLPLAPGPYAGNPESLSQYRCPEWFRDAKFGIWAHWGPQAVPMDGDWYARGMYEPGNKHYQYHRDHYGHPSTNGYKDIIPLWKAERWDPDRLMALYQKAGAKYFVSMATHHDNFFLWNSKLHRWNAVNMGPHRDVVGDWQQAARKYGLKFGVSEHLGASFTWFQSSHRADKDGPFASVPYDGANPDYQDLYHFPAEPGDTGWYSTNPRWQQMWYDRIQELVDLCRPDLLYTDGAVPFTNQVGHSLIAHLYNADRHRRGTRNEVVYTCKQKSDGRWIEDLERGVMPGINPDPWQTDTSIGDWYYNRNWKFRPVNWTIHMLVDIVSKNGNLLLNVVQRPDGSLDPEVLDALNRLAGWVAIHGEAIYGTRPWTLYGEGPVRAKGGHFKEDFAYTAQDVRFTTKGKTLYALALGLPEDGHLRIKSLARSDDRSQNRIRRVSLLGHRGNLRWTQTAEGLEVVLPQDAKLSPYTVGLKISGSGLRPVPQPEVHPVVSANSQGHFTLTADLAEFHGTRINTEAQGGQPNIGFWDNPQEWVSWTLDVKQPGRFRVAVACATVHPGSEFTLETGTQTLPAKVPQTTGWDRFTTTELGMVDLATSGPCTVSVRPANGGRWRATNLRAVTLTRIP